MKKMFLILIFLVTMVLKADVEIEEYETYYEDQEESEEIETGIGSYLAISGETTDIIFNNILIEGKTRFLKLSGFIQFLVDVPFQYGIEGKLFFYQTKTFGIGVELAYLYSKSEQHNYQTTVDLEWHKKDYYYSLGAGVLFLNYKEQCYKYSFEDTVCPGYEIVYIPAFSFKLGYKF